MILSVDNLNVLFPFEIIYPEQIQIAYIIKKSFDKKNHSIMGTPSGIGLPFVIFCFFLSYKKFLKIKKTLLYWVTNEIETFLLLQEWKLMYKKLRLFEHKKSNFLYTSVCAILDKKKLCIDSRINSELNIQQIEDLCYHLIFYYTSKKKEKILHKKILKKRTTCLFFRNFLYEYKKLRVNSILTSDELREKGIRSKICPFYWLRSVMVDADIIVGNVSDLFLSRNFNLFSTNQLKYSFSVFDNVYEIDGLFSNFLCFQISEITIKDSYGTFLFLKKLLIKQSLKKMKPLVFKKMLLYLKKNTNPYKKFVYLIHDCVYKNNFSNDCFICLFFKNYQKKKKIRRLFQLIYFLQELIFYFRNFVFNNLFSNKYIKKIVENFKEKMHTTDISFSYVNKFFKQLFKLKSSIHVLENRKYESVKKLLMFVRILFFYEESMNENIYFIFNSKKKYKFLSEASLNFVCTESTLLFKLIFEKIKCVIFFTNVFSDLKIYILIVNYKPFIYGTINYINLKYKNILTSINQESKTTKLTDLNNMSFYFFTYILSIVSEGLIFFSKIFFFFFFSRLYKKKPSLLPKKAKILIETGDFSSDVSFLENYKLYTDLGIKCFFIGFYGGILFESNVSFIYRRKILMFDNSHRSNSHISNLVKKLFFLNNITDFKKFWHNFLFLKKNGYILNNFFSLKEDYVFFIKISIIRKIVSLNTSVFYLKIFETFILKCDFFLNLRKKKFLYT
nr:DNA repair helicase component of transcription factor b [Cryptomonas paramecium]